MAAFDVATKLGIDVPDVSRVEVGGQDGTAMRWIDGIKDGGKPSLRLSNRLAWSVAGGVASKRENQDHQDSMRVEFQKCTCASCGQRVEYPIEAGGQSISCPSCSTTIQLPLEGAPSPTADEALGDELLTICRSITEDGELTDKELYALYEWINAHPTAASVWPGTELDIPLRDAWADGKINKTELRSFGRLLTKIEREATARSAKQIGTEALNNFSLVEALLPKANVQCDVRSSDGTSYYRVDLNDASCNCPDWLHERSRLQAGSVSRCCKHVAEAFRTISPEGGWPGWFEGLLSDCVARGRGTDPKARWGVITVSRRQVLVGVSDADWANVYTDEEFGNQAYVHGEIWEGLGDTRFGFNYRENRWSYGTAPRGARTIKEAIKSMIAG